MLDIETLAVRGNHEDSNTKRNMLTVCDRVPTPFYHSHLHGHARCLHPYTARPTRCRRCPGKPGALAMAVYIPCLWTVGQVITISLRGGAAQTQEHIKEIASEWLECANVQFQYVADWRAADVRIDIVQPGEGAWSLVGSDRRSIATDEPTMQLDLDGDVFEVHVKGSILHEFGHMLGAVHEHQQPHTLILWDIPAILVDHPDWTREDVDRNYLKKYQWNMSATAYDRFSIMHYPVPSRWTQDGYSVPFNTKLSDKDKEKMREMYPASTRAMLRNDSCD